MAKLYPPRIEGTLPAFYGTTLVVPFIMNRVVSASEVTNMVIKIKKVNTNEVILTKYANNFSIQGNCSATFIFTEEEKNKCFSVGQFYRVQIAFVGSNNTLGYFSSVGVIKYTGLPSVTLLNLDQTVTNIHSYDYVGQYEQTLDPTEKLYSSRLRLMDMNKNIILDSGEVVHSVLNDTIPNQALEIFQFNQDLEFNQTYKIQFTVTTVNGLTISSPVYKIMQRENTDMMFDETKKLNVKVISDFNEGHATISLEPLNLDETETITGTFLLSRTEAVLPYHWEKIQNFLVRGDKVTQLKFKDYTVEQGKTYIYAIQQYNNYNIYSGKILSNKIYIDFEDVFILDGSRQLKIRYNPKISSMKNNILETKVNTIGSRYPFITRNGRVNHKEFSLSGLISYHMDENATFIKASQLNLDERHTQLTSDNIYAERIFKLEVLNWLNDGKPKILKTATEGNYIVRIMGVNMTPNDTLGRMLHTFSCTASEIAPFNYESLTKYSFIELEELDKTITRWKTIKLSEITQDVNGEPLIIYRTGELLPHPVQAIRLTDMMPGSQFQINGMTKNDEDVVFHIGVTGSYYVKSDTQISSLKIPEGSKYTGTLEIEYKDLLTTSFDYVRNMELEVVPAHQFIGLPAHVNIVDLISDKKTKILNISRIQFIKRKVHKIYIEYSDNADLNPETLLNQNFYINGYSRDNNYIINLEDLEQLNLYEIYYSTVGLNVFDDNGKMKYEKNGKTIEPFTGYIYDPYTSLVSNSIENKNMFSAQVNNEFIDLSEIEERTIKGLEGIETISSGLGVLVELTYYKQTMDYSFEYEYPEVVSLRKNYDTLLNQLKKEIVNPNSTVDLDMLSRNVKLAYQRLIEKLDMVIQEKYTQGG